MEIRDEDPAIAIEQIDDWVMRHLPSHVVAGVQEQELDHETQFLAAYGRAVAQFEVEFSALVGTIDRLNFVEREIWPPHRYIQYALLAHNLKPLRSAMDRVMKGYYEDALALLRVAYETFIRLMFISVHHEDPWGALMRKSAPPTPPFILTQFVRDQLRLRWATSYSVLSAFTHSNSVTVADSLNRAANREGEPERFGLSIEFDSTRIELVLPQLQFALLTYLRFTVDRLVGSELQPHVPEAAVAIDSVYVMTLITRTHPKPYWQDVADDLDYLFDLIAAAEVGADWKKLAKARPEVPNT